MTCQSHSRGLTCCVYLPEPGLGVGLGRVQTVCVHVLVCMRVCQ